MKKHIPNIKIHIPHNKIERILNLEKHGAVKLFDFQAPNDFATRSIWEVVDKDKFEAARKVNEKEFLFFLATEEMVKNFEKYKISTKDEEFNELDFKYEDRE